MENCFDHTTIYWDEKTSRSLGKKLLGEEPLSIRVQGKPYSVVMRTPGDEIPHAAGFCLSEGIVDTPEDFAALGLCDEGDSNVVTATLTFARRKKIPDLFERREFISQTSCGICGKELVDDLRQEIRPITDNSGIDLSRALACLEGLSDRQPLRAQTNASHAAALFNRDFELLAVAEDVGRHNALDKAIGKLFLESRLSGVAFVILSSRISYELVQKAARARIPIILALSRPTALAVALASELNMTLASLAEESGLYIFNAEHRLLR